MSYYIDDETKSILNSVVAPNGPYRSESEAVRKAIIIAFGGKQNENSGRN